MERDKNVRPTDDELRAVGWAWGFPNPSNDFFYLVTPDGYD